MKPTPKIPRTAVQSSNVQSFGYDAATKLLSVQFKGGGTYHYHDVPQDKILGLDNAESFGSYLNQNIKGKHRFTKA